MAACHFRLSHAARDGHFLQTAVCGRAMSGGLAPGGAQEFNALSKPGRRRSAVYQSSGTRVVGPRRLPVGRADRRAASRSNLNATLEKCAMTTLTHNAAGS